MATPVNRTLDLLTTVDHAGTGAGDTADPCRLVASLGLQSRADLWVVRLADEAASDDREPVAGDEANAADSARETVDVVGILTRSHHQLGRGDRLMTRRAGARRAEHSARSIHTTACSEIIHVKRPEKLERQITEPDERTLHTKPHLALALLPFSQFLACLLYTSPSPRDRQKSRMPSSA